MADMVDTIVDDIKARWHVYAIILALAGGGAGLVVSTLTCPEPVIYLWSHEGSVRMDYDAPTDPDGGFVMFQWSCPELLYVPLVTDPEPKMNEWGFYEQGFHPDPLYIATPGGDIVILPCEDPADCTISMSADP